MLGPYRDRKVKLALPPRARIAPFVVENFEPFIRRVAENSTLPMRHSVDFEGGAIVLDFDPKRLGNQDAGHLSYNVPYSTKRNPVYRALKSKKSQLKNCGFGGLKGIILCDASCKILTSHYPNGVAYSLASIVHGFLRETKSVDFVLTVGVSGSHSSGSQLGVSLKPELFAQRNMSDGTMRGLEKALSLALAQIPNPECAGYQALYRLERGVPPDARFGALASRFTFSTNMEPAEIRVSNRLLLGLLSGEVSQDQFRAMHEIEGNTGKPPLYLLEVWAKEGRMISEAVVERHADEDDDHIVLKFGPPDPAASRFRMPKGGLKR